MLSDTLGVKTAIVWNNLGKVGEGWGRRPVREVELRDLGAPGIRTPSLKSPEQPVDRGEARPGGWRCTK